MENDLSQLTFEAHAEDIKQYLSVPIVHLNSMILKLEILSDDEVEKEHIIDILKECLYYRQELQNLISQINDSDYEKEELFNQIKLLVKNTFNIEDELISDYPEHFSNQDGQWCTYIALPKPTKSLLPSETSKPIQSTIHKKSRLRLKDLSFGLFFLLPAFLFITLYPWINNKINKDEEMKNSYVIHENDRAYKNLFYIYSAVLTGNSNDSNFYSLIKSGIFKIPEGFVLLDKNMIVDYYLKEYYGLMGLENQTDITVISVNNLNYIQCKYIITKFSGISLPAIFVNGNQLAFTENFKIEQHCNKETKGNIVSLYIRKS